MEDSSERRPLDLRGDLNPAQLRAATADAGVHLVVAGAGTGKTRTLVYRVAHLVSRGAQPESLLLLTFTRRAAEEMLRRATAISGDGCRRVAGGTFHGFGHTVLRRHGHLIGYKAGFTILDKGDAADVVGMVRTEGGFARSGRRFPRKDTLANLFSKRINTGRDLEALIAEEMPQFAGEGEAIAKLMEGYGERKRAQNVLDYDDLLVGLRDLLAAHEDVRNQLARRFRHVLVDEYQDTNRLQAHIAALLGAACGNLMVVGDEAQSIYGFRGADFRNIVDFEKVFPAAETLKLELNYRSTQPILDLANAILARAREGFEKRLRSAHDEGRGEAAERPRLVRTEDEHSQARFVAERVLALREQGRSLADIAVLGRAGWHLGVLELELAERNVPFRKYGGLQFLEAAHIKDVLALLRLGSNPLDAVAWFRVLQLASGVGPATAHRLTTAVIDRGGDLAALESPRVKKQRYGKTVAELAATVRRLGSEEIGLMARLELALETYRQLMPMRYDDATARARDLDALPVIAGRFDSLQAFLAALAIEPPQRLAAGGDDAEDEVLTLSTVHSAKGLEWQTVFILDLVDGHFPSRAAVQSDDYEEERRLLYVAVTRARGDLYLMRPETLTQRGGWGHRLAPISPLLAELDLDSLVEETLYRPAPEPLDGDGDGQPTKGPSSAGDEAWRRIQAYFGDD